MGLDIVHASADRNKHECASMMFVTLIFSNLDDCFYLVSKEEISAYSFSESIEHY